MGTRACPDCLTPLQPLTLRGAELERCTCGGVWLPFGQLDQVLEQEVKSDALGGETSRRCPDCTLSMTPVVLAGGVPVETCTTCRGVWLDWPDVVDLGVAELEAAVRPAPGQRYAPFVSPEPEAAKSVGGFVCAKCGARTAFAQGHGSAGELICGACVAVIQPIPRVPDVMAMLPDLDLDDV